MSYTKRFIASVLVAVSATLVLTVCLALAHTNETKREAQEATLAAVPEKFGAVPATTPIIGATRLVFTSDRDGNEEIYTQAGDNSPQVNLTNHPARDVCPVLSPDGTKIAFASDRGGLSNIHVMNSDGSNVQRVTHLIPDSGSVRVHDPAWSPDGKKLVYVSSSRLGGGSSRLEVINADGSGNTAFIGTTPGLADPAWSPD
ncbi:MAG TPA: hypothetical protein VF634_05965, partial [Pyrinomonadaceae bacterium]